MARTNSRKISRRAVKKKSPLPSVLLILYMAGLGITYVSLHMSNRKLEYSLEAKQNEVIETQNLIRNIKTEVEKMTGRSFIMSQIRKFNMDLGPAENGQIVEVSHISQEDRLKPQKLRNEREEERKVTKN